MDIDNTVIACIRSSCRQNLCSTESTLSVSYKEILIMFELICVKYAHFNPVETIFNISKIIVI